MARYKAFGVQRVKGSAGVRSDVRMPRELEIPLKAPLSEKMIVVLHRGSQEARTREGGK